MKLDVELSDDPILALQRWYAQASDTLPRDTAHRIALATAEPNGRPSVRIVLCRQVDESGRLYFYTNYESRKGQQLASNPYAAVAFHWPSLGRQLRVEGLVERTSSEVSDRYWAGRPRESQLSALASPQSTTIAGLGELETNRAALGASDGGHHLPRPDHWGGYRLVPAEIEFWQEGESRFHSRIHFCSTGGRWASRYLAP